MKEKPDNTPIRADTKRILKMRAAYHGMSLVEYLDAVLNDYFDENEESSKNEKRIIEKRDET